ncbi:hypothetical protein [Corynebacterium riegelii]|nr:hypothetical protein [Corynebacterium riegelii]
MTIIAAIIVPLFLGLFTIGMERMEQAALGTDGNSPADSATPAAM